MTSKSQKDPQFRKGQTNKNGRIICGAQKGNGQKCMSTVTLSNGRCRMHGGKNVGGVTHPTYKTGEHSKHLPRRLRETFEAFYNSPDQLTMRESIALVDTRLAELLGKIDPGESGKLWRDARQAWRDLNEAVEDGDSAAQNKHAAKLNSLLNQGVRDYAVWDEIGRQLEQKRKLSETEQKRIMNAQQFVTNEKALMLMHQIELILKNRIQDRGLLTTVASDIALLKNQIS
jgi:hypothetical protein